MSGNQITIKSTGRKKPRRLFETCKKTLRDETEQYDGTTYTTTASLATARRLGAGAGTGSLALYSAGQPTNSTEEFTDTTEPVRSFDVS